MKERRLAQARVPNLSTLAGKLREFSRIGRALPLLYVEFSNDAVPGVSARRRLRAAYKQAIAAALKTSVGSLLRKDDLVAAGAGGQWFIALLTTRARLGRRPQASDPDLGVAADRLRRAAQQALVDTRAAQKNGSRLQPRIAVRCGWSVLEPVDPEHPLEALRHAVRGAAVVARIEERRATVLAAVTHELRTPLTSIIGFVERLQQEGPLSRNQRRRYLGIVADEARRLHRLAEGLIDVGSWTAGSLKLAVQRHELAAIAREAVLAISERAERKKISIRISGSATALVDRDRCLQILINVLDNAVRHTSEGRRIDIQITGRAHECTVAIRDQGLGFSPAMRRSIGQPFARGVNGKVGLGLAISRLLAHAHGGKLILTSGRGRGGLVRVTLPAVKAVKRTIPQERTDVCE